MNEGIIYIAQNPEYKEEIYKIGKTERTNLPENRMLELSNHEGVLGEFRVVGYWLVDEVHETEKICHSVLKNFRYQQNREFFKADLYTIIERIRSMLSEKIIRDNFPVSKKINEESKIEDKNVPIGHYRFYLNLINYIGDAIDSSSKVKSLMYPISKEFKKLRKNTETFWSAHPLYNSAMTERFYYTLAIDEEYKDFMYADAYNIHNVFEKEDIKKNYPERIADVEGWLDAIRKIELVSDNDPEYFNKIKQTQEYIKKIYENDKLFVEYQNKKSKLRKEFDNLDNYIWHAFFTVFEIKKHDSGLREFINPQTTYWKGSLDRVLTEFKDIITHATHHETD